jgi:hypothetical protein
MEQVMQVGTGMLVGKKVELDFNGMTFEVTLKEYGD